MKIWLIKMKWAVLSFFGICTCLKERSAFQMECGDTSMPVGYKCVELIASVAESATYEYDNYPISFTVTRCNADADNDIDQDDEV